MRLKAREITSDDHSEWDELINSSPQGSIILLNDCLCMLANTDPSLHFLRFGCFNEQNKLVGGLVLFYSKKVLGIRVQLSMNLPGFYYTPILSGNIIQGSPEYFSIMKTLAEKTQKFYLFFRLKCHPSIRDIRPLLDMGWSAFPEYTHTWDLHDPVNLLAELRSKGRYRNASNILERLVFSDETGSAIVKEFSPLYRKTASGYGLELENAWDTIFFQRMDWLLNQDAVRCFTCRKKTGELLGVSIYVLSPAQHTVYGWVIAYDLSLGEKNFLGVFYMYVLQIFSGKFSIVDIAEGIRPTLYDFKDSLGTDSTPYFVVCPPRTEFLNNLYRMFTLIKRHVKRLVH